MASNYDITMRQFNGIDYDTLYPKTKLSQIDGLDTKFGNYYTKTETSNLFLPKAGGTMGGILDMNGNRISNVANPTNDNDAVNKSYVDGKAYTKTLINSQSSSFTVTSSNRTVTLAIPTITMDSVLYRNASGVIYTIQISPSGELSETIFRAGDGLTNILRIEGSSAVTRTTSVFISVSNKKYNWNNDDILLYTINETSSSPTAFLSNGDHNNIYVNYLRGSTSVTISYNIKIFLVTF